MIRILDPFPSQPTHRPLRCSTLWPHGRPVDGRRRRTPGLVGGQDPVPTRGVGEVLDALQRVFLANLTMGWSLVMEWE